MLTPPGWFYSYFTLRDHSGPRALGAKEKDGSKLNHHQFPGHLIRKVSRPGLGEPPCNPAQCKACGAGWGSFPPLELQGRHHAAAAATPGSERRGRGNCARAIVASALSTALPRLSPRPPLRNAISSGGREVGHRRHTPTRTWSWKAGEVGALRGNNAAQRGPQRSRGKTCPLLRSGGGRGGGVGGGPPPT